MAFTVGMKVLCIGDHVSEGWHRCGPVPQRGHIYTIRGFTPAGYHPNGTANPRVYLEEIVHAPVQWATGVFEIGFGANRFRPLVSRKTEISFTIGADPESEKWDNRKPMPVYSFDVAGHEDIMQYLRGFY